MAGGAKAFGHPIHPTLIVFPLGLLATAVVFDIIRIITGNPTWSHVAFYMIAAGVIGGLAAAVFGLVDWLAVTSGTRAKRVGSIHGLGNLAVVLLFAASWWLRLPQRTEPTTLALTLSFLGAALSFYTGWLGGELVFRYGLGVEQQPGSDGEK